MGPATDDELIQEKNLRQVYRASRSMPVSRFNQGATIAVFTALVAYGYATPEGAHAVAEKTRTLADYGFSFATSILSFLIAGFTIYISVMKVDLIEFLSSEREERSGLPWIKFTAFHFLRVMALYVAFCLLCIGIKLFASTGGPLSVLLTVIMDDPAVSKGWMARIGLATVGASLVYMVLLLQSFIYNIYHSSMFAIVFERNQQRKKSAGNPQQNVKQ